MKALTAFDRNALIRLASGMPKGSPERRAILAGLQKVGMEFPSKEALEKYLHEHPNAERDNHTVAKPRGEGEPVRWNSQEAKRLTKDVQKKTLSLVKKTLGEDGVILKDERYAPSGQSSGKGGQALHLSVGDKKVKLHMTFNPETGKTTYSGGDLDEYSTEEETVKYLKSLSKKD